MKKPLSPEPNSQNAVPNSTLENSNVTDTLPENATSVNATSPQLQARPFAPRASDDATPDVFSLSNTSLPTLSLSTISRVLLDAVFPLRCAAWNAKNAVDSSPQSACEIWSREFFCAACRETLRLLLPPFCACCGAPFDVSAQISPQGICADCRENRYHKAPPYDALRSVYRFEGAIRHAVHRLKYDGKSALAPPLASLLRDYLENRENVGISGGDAFSHAISSTRFVEIPRVTHLVAVPLHRTRLRQRGYNQSELLARELGKTTRLPVANWLQRVRITAPQVELSRKERAENVRDAFAFDDGRATEIEASVVLLIDDVYTTGATLRECARTLKAAGAAKVYGLTLAHQV